VRHLSDGTLRRIYDEPLALTSSDQAHFDSCSECKAHFESIANTARATASMLSVPGFTPEPAAALRSVRMRIRTGETARPPRWYERWLDRTSRWRPIATPAIAVVLAAVLLTGVTATGLAQSWFRVFEPRTVAPVQVVPSDFAGTGALLDYGAVTWLPDAPTLHQLSDATAASAQSGLPVLMPASLPKGVTGAVSFGVVSHATGSLTFDAQRLVASAAKNGVHVNPMPARISGSKLIVNAGPALLEAWGLSATASEVQMPTLVIAQTRVPTVDSTGATATELEDYLLSQPGVPPDIAAQIKAIKDPSTTLPIPIPKGLATTEQVQVNGVPGLLIKAVLGAGVVWEGKNGVIYAVGGQLTPDQVLAIATSLH
jgi:predicted anti-sigma-YlaC factor YlaD